MNWVISFVSFYRAIFFPYLYEYEYINSKFFHKFGPYSIILYRNYSYGYYFTKFNFSKAQLKNYWAEKERFVKIGSIQVKPFPFLNRFFFAPRNPSQLSLIASSICNETE